MIRAIVKEGRWEERGAEDYLAGVIIERRDKIVRYYLSRINPVDGFELSGRSLQFTNLGVQAGLAPACDYEYEWYRFDNATQKAAPLGPRGSTGETALTVPEDDTPFLMVRISSNCPQQPEWAKPVAVYLRNGASPQIVGIERH